MKTDEILLMLFAIYGQEEKTTRIKAYTGMLKAYPVEQLKLACEMLARKSKYLPSVAEIVETIEAQSGEVPALSWAAARAEIEKMMYRYGCTGKEPPFSNEAIKLTVRAMGGIDTWALSEDREIGYVWNNAEKLYAEYSKAASAGTFRKELDSSSEAARKLSEGMAISKWILTR